jgi:hypothetical protein
MPKDYAANSDQRQHTDESFSFVSGGEIDAFVPEYRGDKTPPTQAVKMRVSALFARESVPLCFVTFVPLNRYH